MNVRITMEIALKCVSILLLDSIVNATQDML